MKAGTTALKNLIRQSDEVSALPKLTIEWEHNRFTPFQNTDAPVSVTPAVTPDLEWNDIYDLSAIALPNRPRTGMAKARFDTNGKLKAADKYRNTPQQSRFYISTSEDQYKYWSSQQRTGLVQANGGYAFDVPIELTLNYATPVIANKVVIGFETSYAKPSNFSVSITTDGNNWTAIGNSPEIDFEGRVSLWRDSNNNWGSAKTLVDPVSLMTKPKIKGVRVTVYSMNASYSHLDVLQMGARLESDVSDYVETYSRDFEISDRSLIAPLGGASSNTASVDLNNMERLFNNDNTKSPFYGLIGKKAKFTMDLSFDVRPSGGADERIREFTMWVDRWAGQEETTIQVDLKDSSVYLQELNSPKVFWGSTPVNAYVGETSPIEEQITVGAIIWQLMDLVGFSNYQYTTDALDNGQTVQYYWPDGDSTVWDEISELAEGTQTAVYFDEYDVMQIKTRNAMFSAKETIDWNLDATRNGVKLADIVSLESEEDLVANRVDVGYKPTKFTNFNNGLPSMETVWEPDQDTVVLRASSLKKDVLVNETSLYINYVEAATWPYESLVNIRGEMIRYKGKSYIWTDKNGVKQNQWCYSAEDKARMDAASDPNLAFQNVWGGYLKISERGVSGTAVSNHYLRPNGYNAKVSDHKNNGFYPLAKGTGMNYYNGVMTLVSPGNIRPTDYFLQQHETVIPSANAQYGARMRFPSAQVFSNRLAISGLFIAGDWGDAGYFVQLSPTEFIETEKRSVRHELTIVAMPGNAPGFNLPGVNGDIKGFPAAIHYDQWIDVDVRHVDNRNGTATVTVYLNGVWAGAWNIPFNVRNRWVDQGKWGVFNTYVCKTDFEYIYAMNLNDASFVGTPDQTSVLDLQRGGLTSGFIERDWRYGYFSSVNWGPGHEGSYRFDQQWSNGNFVLDEFGPVVHEVREFEIVFEEDNIPVAHSYLYMTNEAQAVCTDYYTDPYGARFTLVNASRRNAILKGEDKITLGANDPIDHNMFIYGRILKQEDELNIVKEDKASIRRNGVTSVEFDNRFIQNEAAATDIAEWVVRLWGGRVDEVVAEIFGNPFIQLGDLVTISYPLKDMYPATHKYFVVGVNNDFDTGLETTLVLRRARI